MLTIRLARQGKKSQVNYRLIVSEKARDTYGKSLEIFGFYNPHTKELNVKADRIQYWISKGAGTSPTINNLLIKNEIIKGDIKKTTKITKKRAEKIKKAADEKAPKLEAKPEEVKTEENK